MTVLGKPFKPGHDPRRDTSALHPNNNPWGRHGKPETVQLKEARALASQNAPQAIDVLQKLMQDTNRHVALKAAVEMLTWAYGRPSTWVENETGLPTDVHKLPREQQLELMKERLAAYNQAVAILESQAPDQPGIKEPS